MNDLATEMNQEALLNAEICGQEQLNTFVQKRLMMLKEGSAHIKVLDLKKRRSLTFSYLYAVGKEKQSKDKVITIKADCLIYSASLLP